VRLTRAGFAALSLTMLFGVACGASDDDDDTPMASATASTSATAQASSTAAASATVGPAFQGTIDKTEKELPGVVVTVVDVRTGEQAEGYDRIVFEFEGTQIPGYSIEYVVPPLAQCGSGQSVDIEGEALLSIKLRTAAAHDDQGQVTIDSPEILAAHPEIVEAEQSCDFEGLVQWGVGVTEKQPYRVLELSGPPRIAVDILHP
ncbi:MAG: AMIN-like domain-containing (lipo)protein, partial [Tepidiformaceae bacterium]